MDWISTKLIYLLRPGLYMKLMLQELYLLKLILFANNNILDLLNLDNHQQLYIVKLIDIRICHSLLIFLFSTNIDTYITFKHTIKLQIDLCPKSPKKKKTNTIINVPIISIFSLQISTLKQIVFS